MAKKPVLLCIMDGFGWVPEQTFGNAIAAARRPNLDRLFETYPYTTIQASGMAVGLPEGQMGNSEVGHTNMGAGRIVYQQLTLITKSIMDGTMKENDVLVRNMRAAIDAGKAVHLMGLLGTGGVHSHIDHTCSACWIWPSIWALKSCTSTASWTAATPTRIPARASLRIFKRSSTSWAWAKLRL